MSLNDIQLNTSLIADLYKNSLVEIEKMKEADEKPLSSSKGKKQSKEISTPAWNFLGKNQKDVLLIVRYPDTTHLPDEQLNFITGALTACKLGLADVAILNISHTPSGKYKEIYNEFKSKVTILFGVTPAEFEMPVDFPEFQVQAFNNCTYLHSPELSKLEADKVLKSKFWVCLRRLFDI